MQRLTVQLSPSFPLQSSSAPVLHLHPTSIPPLPPSGRLMAISASILDPLIASLGPLRASGYLAGASLVLVLYDWLITLEDEVELIIPTPWTVVKVLYTIIRVVTPTGLFIATYHLSPFREPLSPTSNLDHQFCHAWIWILMITQIIIVASSSYLMLRRLCPLYGNDRRVTISLNFAFFATYITVTILSLVAAHKLAPTLNYAPVVDLCSTAMWAESKAAGSAIFVGPMAFESLVFVLTAWKAYFAVASRRTLYASPLHQIFFRDGLIHYACILLVRILNIFIYFAMPLEYYYIGVFLLWAVVATSTTRLFINLRAVSRGPDVWAKPDVPTLGKFEMLSRNQYRSSAEQPKIQDIMISVVTETTA